MFGERKEHHDYRYYYIDMRERCVKPIKGAKLSQKGDHLCGIYQAIFIYVCCLYKEMVALFCGISILLLRFLDCEFQLDLYMYSAKVLQGHM